jgi:phospholipase C
MPIEHLVAIFGENVSFDDYFGTYPDAANPAGEPAFTKHKLKQGRYTLIARVKQGASSRTLSKRLAVH